MFVDFPARLPENPAEIATLDHTPDYITARTVWTPPIFLARSGLPARPLPCPWN